MGRFSSRCFSLLAFVFSLAGVTAFAQQGQIGAIHVSGMQVYPEQAVVKCSGLHVRDPFSQDELNAAAQRLVDSGFFLSANYRYEPAMKDGKPVYAVTLQVREDRTALATAVIDIPGVDGAVMLADLGKQDAFLSSMLPDTDGAQAYYRQQIEAALTKAGHPQTITVKREGALGSNQMTLVFRPANLPKLTSVQFAGNQVLPAKKLEAALHSVVVGEDYSERDLRQALDLNVTPLYEEQGYLHVSYPSVAVQQSAGGTVAVTVSVSEEHAWNLGNVEIAGDALPVSEMMSAARFPIGHRANWKQIEADIEAMQLPLRSTGFLARRVRKPVRTFHPETGTVDIRIPVAKGPQFVLGEVRFDGFPPAEERRERSRWKMASGAPYDETYGMAFYKELLQGVRDSKVRVAMHLQQQSSKFVMDAVFEMKQGS